MLAVVQRVSKASVSVDGVPVASIGRGLLVLLGVTAGDGTDEAAYVAGKISRLRIFADEQRLMNLSVKDVGGAVLVVSQFTLLADTRKGNRPSFTGAAGPEPAERLYLAFVEDLRRAGLEVQTGVFGETMAVELINDGPVTIIVSSERRQAE